MWSGSTLMLEIYLENQIFQWNKLIWVIRAQDFSEEENTFYSLSLSPFSTWSSCPFSNTHFRLICNNSRQVEKLLKSIYSLLRAAQRERVRQEQKNVLRVPGILLCKQVLKRHYKLCTCTVKASFGSVLEVITLLQLFLLQNTFHHNWDL